MEESSTYQTSNSVAAIIAWAVVLFVVIYFSLVSFSFDFLKCKKGRLRPWAVFCWSILLTLLFLLFMWFTARFSSC